MSLGDYDWIDELWLTPTTSDTPDVLSQILRSKIAAIQQQAQQAQKKARKKARKKAQKQARKKARKKAPKQALQAQQVPEEPWSAAELEEWEKNKKWWEEQAQHAPQAPLDTLEVDSWCPWKCPMPEEDKWVEDVVLL